MRVTSKIWLPAKTYWHASGKGYLVPILLYSFNQILLARFRVITNSR